MKNTIISALMALASLPLLHGATTITATNAASGVDPTGFLQQVITGVDGTPFVGTVLIGTFSTPAGLGTTTGPISLANYGWTQFGSAAFSSSASYPGVFGAFGGTGVTGTLPTTATGALVGNNIYAVVGNAAGTDFIVWNSGLNFAAEDAVLGGAAVGFQTRNATLVRGIVDPNGNNGITGAALSARNGQAAVTFGVVPEPSAALLGAIGALGLLRRRRN